jgi:mannose-6-phosphate isomerase
MNRICLMKNPVQEYAWGSKSAIQDLLRMPVPSETPMAEMWMGAHPKGTSEVLVDGQWKPLDGVIKASPESILGKSVATGFSNSLPFLFKFLAAEKPLSVQVHPNLERAREGFARENALGLPLDAPDRNYRDPNHKPELFVAVTNFECLIGFRRIEEILSLTERVAPSSLSDELGRLKKEPDATGLNRFYSALMSLDASRKKRVVGEAVDCAEELIAKDAAFRWMAELSCGYPEDMGVLSPVILNYVELKPGEAVYLKAGEPHAYLKGAGVEVMANSDNVLRGGLTPKHMDVPELLKIVHFKTGPVQRIQPEQGKTCERFYRTTAREFLLSVIQIKKDESFVSPSDRSIEILLCMEGEAEIKDEASEEVLTLAKGTSVCVPAAVSKYRIEGRAMLYKASVPL